MADEQVTSQDISGVSNKDIIQATWPKLAVALDSDTFNVGKIAVIKQQHLVDPFMQLYSMLDNWRSKRASEATRRILIKALIKCGWTSEARSIFGDMVTLADKPPDHVTSEDSGRHSYSLMNLHNRDRLI